MSGPIFLSQVPMLGNPGISALGTPLQPLQAFQSPVIGRAKLPLSRFAGLPVIARDAGIDDGIEPCGVTRKLIDYVIPDEFADKRGGTIVQELFMFWIVFNCRPLYLISHQPPVTFWEGFKVDAHDPAHTLPLAVDEWWLNGPPAGPGTFGRAVWRGRVAFFPGMDPAQLGLAARGHPLSGDKPSSAQKPAAWRDGPLPESNALWHELVRSWYCCDGTIDDGFVRYAFQDLSNTTTLPEEPPPQPGQLSARNLPLGVALRYDPYWRGGL